MAVALHLVHASLVLVGLVGSCWLLEPSLTARRRMRALRRAVRAGRLTATNPAPSAATRTITAYTLGAAHTGAIALGLLAVGLPLTGRAAVIVPGVAAVAWWLTVRPRPLALAVGVAVGLQYAGHAAAVLLTGGTGPRTLSAAFFCHPAGVTAPRVQLATVPPATAPEAVVGVLGVAVLAAVALTGWLALDGPARSRQ